jgi:hypothetical protein
MSGLDWDDLAGQFRRSGDISVAAREHLDRFGLRAPVVDEFLRWAKETGRG